MNILRPLSLAVAFAAASLSTPLTAQPPAAPSRVAVDALAAPATLSDPILSPDGTHIAARLTNQDKEWIAVWDLRAPPDTAPRTLEQGDFDVRWLRWAGPHRLLLGIQVKQRIYANDVTVSRTISLETTTWRATPLQTGHGIIGDDVIFVDPAGAYALISAQPTATDYPDVLRLDLTTGAATVVQRRITGIWNWFADSAGVVRAGVDYSDTRIRIFYRASAGADLRRIDSRRYTEDGSVIDMIRFFADADQGVVVTNAATGRFAVYGYNFATDTRGDAIFEHPRVDVTSVIMGQNDAIDGVRYEDDRSRIHWLNPALQRIQGIIDRALPNKVNLMLNRSRDGNRILIWSSAADDPGTYYVYDRAARRIETFASPYPQLAGRSFATVRPISFRARDGTEVPGYLTLPPGRAGRDLPLVLMPHGGPFSRDSWEFTPWVQFLASRGYAVLQVNFRGSTGYGRAYVERGFGQWGSGMIDDLEDGVDWLAGQNIIDARRVCVMGASYGGYVALWAPIRRPDRYRCAISFAGISDLRALLLYDNRQFAAPRYSREWRRRVQGEERTDLAAISPLRQAERVRVPVLIAHGTRDRTVPVAQSRNLVRALTRPGTPMESVFYPEAGHGFTRPQDSADFLRRVEVFLARHNPAAAPPPESPPPAPAAASQ
ncbi:MAG TPA: S9 family peptidase [Allosphingosinicella sp.]|nr:S9 family peptidase [Allosphingosinicella sp.]